MPATSILLLEPTQTEAARLAGILESAGHTVSIVDTPAAAAGDAGAHQLLVVDLEADAAAAGDLVRTLRGDSATASLPILCFARPNDVDERVAMLEAGADDVVSRPADARELEARVDALLVRFQRSGGAAVPRTPPAVTIRPHQVVAFFGAKGGVGTTTLAINTALALAERQPGQVALVDLALPLGQVPTHLNLKPRHPFADLVHPESTVDSVRGAAERYADLLDVFCIPEDPEEAERLTLDELRRALQLLTDTYLFVVVDAGATLGSRALGVLAAADRIVLVTVPEIPSLRALLAIEQVLGERRMADRALHVVNHLFEHEPVRRSDIEEALGTTITVEIPHHELLFAKAVNEGTPMIRLDPRAAATERVSRLAAIVSGAPEDEEAQVETGRRRFGLLRRRA